MKPKTCKYCKTKFEPFKPGQITCNWECAHNYVVKQREKAERIEAIADRKTIKLRKEKLKTRRDWIKEAQVAFNAYRRELLKDEPCISCGRFHSGQYHAGHYLSVGAHPELRFIEDNVWKQCQPCNTHLSGNLIEYRKSLIDRIGSERVEWLESYHEPKKYSVEELKIICKEYKIKLSELKAKHHG